MAYVIFFAGLFLGTMFGFVLMALLAVGRRTSEPEMHQPGDVMSSGDPPLDASLTLRWETGHRHAELEVPLGTRAPS
jgi:hypothetical protein